ncbi:uncharacterized protein [Branchiostoma lanceolatum]|uniref:uncharacterized protein n=1 Tax=Branchiostoma lanceolatum TaxID=7740 RepID=UPI003454323B
MATIFQALLVVTSCLQVCIGTSTTSPAFSVSVPENVAVGETIFSLTWIQAGEKAELPCNKMEGDPYNRFTVTKNCTVVVANPLDWSVQPVYLLNIRSGHRNTSVQVELTDINGYPPVYNETCQTPVRPYSNRKTEDLLFQLQFSGEVVTESGDILSGNKVYHNTSDLWKIKPPFDWQIQTDNGDCNVHIVSYDTYIDYLNTLQQLWDKNIHQLKCTSDSKLPGIVIDLYNLKLNIEKDEPRRATLKKYVPESVVNNRDLNFLLIWSWPFPTTKTVSYSCDVPSDIDFSFKSNDIRALVNIEYLDIGITPVGCPVGKYGLRCQRDCICKNGARCHGFNGACKCPPGW